MLAKIYEQNPSEKELQRVVDALERDEIIIYPTDSVYAFGCSLRSPKAIERLRRMKGKTDRSCAFICALALKIPGRETLIAEGSCPGVLLEEERGTGGFGYDPLFLYEPLNKTFAEVTEEEKNQISHRARACEKMLEIMKGLHE